MAHVLVSGDDEVVTGNLEPTSLDAAHDNSDHKSSPNESASSNFVIQIVNQKASSMGLEWQWKGTPAGRGDGNDGFSGDCVYKIIKMKGRDIWETISW